MIVVTALGVLVGLVLGLTGAGGNARQLCLATLRVNNLMAETIGEGRRVQTCQLGDPGAAALDMEQDGRGLRGTIVGHGPIVPHDDFVRAR